MPPPEEKKEPTGPTNARLEAAGKVGVAGGGRGNGGTVSAVTGKMGKGGTMPVMAADQYAEVVLPNLTQLNLEEHIKLDSTIVLIGRRRTGKSWICRHIMWMLKDKIPAGIVISTTSELNHFWEEYIPKRYIFSRYEPEVLDAVFKRQKKILNDNNLTDAEKDKKAPFFVLLDDVISDKRLQYDANLMELFVAGRHHRICCIITSQYAKGVITPTIRGNTDVVFMLRTTQARQKESLWEDFGDEMTKDAFYQTLDAYTEDREVLVRLTDPDLDNSDPASFLYWFKAVDPGKFRMGSKEYQDSAYMQDQHVPPKEGPESASQLMGVEDIMPAPYNQWI